MLCDLKKFSKPQNDKRSKSVKKGTCSRGDPLGEVRAPPRYFSQESVSQQGLALLPAQGGQLRYDHDHSHIEITVIMVIITVIIVIMVIIMVNDHCTIG